MTQEELTGKLNAHGFQIRFWEDQSRALKEFVARLIFSHGSLPKFWCAGEQPEGKGGKCPTTFEMMAQVNPGYFLCVAEKSPGET